MRLWLRTERVGEHLLSPVLCLGEGRFSAGLYTAWRTSCQYSLTDKLVRGVLVSIRAECTRIRFPNICQR